MAITFPRPYPAGIAFAKSQFTLARQDVVTQTQGGALQVMDVGEPLWTLSAVTEPLRWSRRREFAAWHASLRGGRRILAYDHVGSYPITYGAAVLSLVRAAGGGFDGTATLSGASTSSLSLAGLPAGYQAAAGDRLSFPWNGVLAYHEVAEPAVADGAGALTVNVEPPVRLGPAPSVGAVIALVRPPCVMIVKPDTFSLDEGPALAPVSFEAVQVIV